MYSKFNFTNKILFSVFLIAITVVNIGCEEDPVAPQEEHLKAIGMAFYSSGIEVARILRGETADTLFAPLDTLSNHLDVKFFDEDENIIDPPTEHQTLSWEIVDPTIANIWQHEGHEGTFGFHIRGLKIGETEIEFFVMHNDHSDYRSGQIPVKVTN